MNSYRQIGIVLLAGALLLAGFAGNALAWQAAACDTISNTASLTYSVGGVDQTNGGLNPLVSAPATFTVDSLVDLAVDVIATPVNATGLNQVLRFRISNLGNDSQKYGLQLYEGIDATDDDFDMGNVRVYVDNDKDGVLDLPGDTLLAADIGGAGPNFGVTFTDLTPSVSGDIATNPAGANQIEILVVSNVPAGQASADTAAYSLKAITYQATAVDSTAGITITGGLYPAGTIANNSCGNPVVVGDDDDDATKTPYGGVTDEAGNASAYDSGVYTVVAAGVSVAKAVSAPLWDPINGNTGAQAIPGAYVQYTITIANAALSAPATLTQITDALATQLNFDVDLVTSAGPGNPEDAAGNGFKVTHVSGRALASPLYYTSSDADADGASVTADVITALFANLLPAEVGPPAYAAGELKAGESVTLIFNAIIQ